jgi:putative transposase
MAQEQCRTFKFRLHPTVKQDQSLARQLGYQREIYNAAMEERINVWKHEQRSVSYFEQCRTVTDLKDVRPEVLTCGVRLCRGTLKRLDRAFTSFYRRAQQGEIPGYPRFKSESRFDSLQWEDLNGFKIKSEVRRLYLFGIGDIKANYHRPISGTPKAITVKREGSKWWVSVRCIGISTTPLKPTGREIGIDLGLKNIVATSDGELVVARRFGFHSKVRLADARSALARSEPGSKRHVLCKRRLGNIHRRISNQRRNAAHQLSRRLVNEFDLIAIEKLDIAKMVRTRANKPWSQIDTSPFKTIPDFILHKSTYDAGWGILTSLLLYKAESAGRVVAAVDPRYTSQTCAECGHVAARNRVNQAVFRCLVCSHQDHADVNAARNILRAGRALQAIVCADR